MKKLLSTFTIIFLLIAAFLIFCSYCEKKGRFFQLLFGMNENPFMHLFNGFSIHSLFTNLFIRVSDIISFIVHLF
jgi:hypothetical protein